MLPSPAWNSSLWTKGTNSSSSVRTLRVMMKTGMAINIIEKADINIFLAEGGAVECFPEELNDRREHVYFLKSWQEATPIWIDGVQSDMETPKVSCKTLELPLNVHEEMTRYQFRTPPKRTRDGLKLEVPGWQLKSRQYLDLWIELIIAEKTRQMQFPRTSWPFNEGSIFPIVLHLSKESQSKKKRRTSVP